MKKIVLNLLNIKVLRVYYIENILGSLAYSCININIKSSYINPFVPEFFFSSFFGTYLT